LDQPQRVSPQATARPISAGVVVIGRNEGERLMACLRSLRGQPRPLLYVDSGSSDGSPERVRALGVPMLQLDRSRPFSAARARNEGAKLLFEQHPQLRYVQFVDGDCIVAPSWLDAAEAALEADPASAIVFGRLDERHPQASVYNRLCAMEWRSPEGVLDNLDHVLGVTMVRREVFEHLGGYNAGLFAGEDPEFGLRVTQAGHRVRKLGDAMALHDADMLRFSQWWKRSVRAGMAIAQRQRLDSTGPQQHSRREFFSAWFWGLVLPLGAVLLAVPTKGLSLLVMAAGYGTLFWRIVRFRRRLGEPLRDAALYAVFAVMGKFANVQGLIKHRLSGRAGLIEHK
jgi:GT2 family glycosyltransferase